MDERRLKSTKVAPMESNLGKRMVFPESELEENPAKKPNLIQ